MGWLRAALESANEFLISRRQRGDVGEVMGIWLRCELDADLPSWSYLDPQLGALRGGSDKERSVTYSSLSGLSAAQQRRRPLRNLPHSSARPSNEVATRVYARAQGKAWAGSVWESPADTPASAIHPFVCSANERR